MALVITYLTTFKQRDKEEQQRNRLYFFIGAVFIVIFTIIVEILIYYKEKANDSILAEISESNKRLEAKLDPFLKTAELKYPDLPLDDALKQLEQNLSTIQNRTDAIELTTQTIKQMTQKTVFRADPVSKEALPDGNYKIVVKLTPVGINIIPILTIIFSSTNNVEILNMKAKGDTVPPMHFTYKNPENTTIKHEYQNLYPGIIWVTVLTKGDPGGMNFNIDPLLEPESE